MRATVLVRPKEGILDPQGQAVEGSLRKLGFAVGEVRVGRVIDLEFSAVDAEDAQAQIKRMCSDLLANPLIESVEVRLRPA
jgi:phosphoribosylformylglycinamidine synthase subunit PurS